jgi:hypothetical protein
MRNDDFDFLHIVDDRTVRLRRRSSFALAVDTAVVLTTAPERRVGNPPADRPNARSVRVKEPVAGDS